MEFWLNRRNNPFPCVEDREDKLILITPSGRVLKLERNLFHGPFFTDINDEDSPETFSEAQLNSYRLMKNAENEELVEKLEMAFEEMTERQKREMIRLLESQMTTSSITSKNSSVG